MKLEREFRRRALQPVLYLPGCIVNSYTTVILYCSIKNGVLHVIAYIYDSCSQPLCAGFFIV